MRKDRWNGFKKRCVINSQYLHSPIRLYVLDMNDLYYIRLLVRRPGGHLTLFSLRILKDFRKIINKAHFVTLTQNGGCTLYSESS